jgi:hypothetical protein
MANPAAATYASAGPGYVEATITLPSGTNRRVVAVMALEQASNVANSCTFDYGGAGTVMDITASGTARASGNLYIRTFDKVIGDGVSAGDYVVRCVLNTIYGNGTLVVYAYADCDTGSIESCNLAAVSTGTDVSPSVTSTASAKLVSVVLNSATAPVYSVYSGNISKDGSSAPAGCTVAYGSGTAAGGTEAVTWRSSISGYYAHSVLVSLKPAVGGGVDEPTVALKASDWYTQTAATTADTDSWSPSPNRGYYFFFQMYTDTTKADPPYAAPTVSGNNMTWTKLEEAWRTTTNNRHYCALWVGSGGSPTTGVTTVTRGETYQIEELGYQIIEMDELWAYEQSCIIMNGVSTASMNLSQSWDSATAGDSYLLGFGSKKNATYYPMSSTTYQSGFTELYVDSLGDADSASGVVSFKQYNGGAETTIGCTFNSGTAESITGGMAGIEFILSVTALDKIKDEALNVSEVTPRIAGMARVLSEALSLVESSAKFVALRRFVNEALNLVEVAVKRANLSRIVNESLNMVEDALKLLGITLLKIVNESMSVVEGTAKSFAYVFTKIVNEALNLVETSPKVRGIGRVANEFVLFVESAYYSFPIAVAKVFRDTITGIRSVVDRLTSIRTHSK